LCCRAIIASPPARPSQIQDIAKEAFLGMSNTAPSLRVIIDNYLKRSGVAIHAEHEIDNLGMAMSLVASTRGVTLLPAYARNFLPVVGDQPSPGKARRHDRSRDRLQQGEHVSDPEAVLSEAMT